MLPKSPQCDRIKHTSTSPASSYLDIPITNTYNVTNWNSACNNKVQFNVLLLLLLLFGVRCARPGESENTLSVERPQPHTTNPWKEEKDKTVGDKNERADHANKKTLALLLKPASPKTSNTGSLRDREGHKASAILKSPTTMKRERVPMSNQSTTSNTRRQIRQRQCTA